MTFIDCLLILELESYDQVITAKDSCGSDHSDYYADPVAF